MDQKVIDSHFHVFDLNVRDNFPNKNESHGFPPPGVIGRSVYIFKLMNSEVINTAQLSACYRRTDSLNVFSVAVPHL